MCSCLRPRPRMVVVQVRSLDSTAALQLLRKVNEAAKVFESRWTMGALARLDPALAKSLHEQIQLYQQAAVTGTMADLTEHAGGLARGYRYCAAKLEDAGVEDDAYLIGVDSATGCRVAIGDRRASAERVAEMHGNRVVWLNPDEVARLWASIEGLTKIEPLKEFFPGAEIVDVRKPLVFKRVAEDMPKHPDDEVEDDE